LDVRTSHWIFVTISLRLNKRLSGIRLSFCSANIHTSVSRLLFDFSSPSLFFPQIGNKMFKLKIIHCLETAL